MILILKKQLNGAFLGYEITDYIDKTMFSKDKLYDKRMILDIQENERNDFDCIIYEITLSNEVIIN